MSRPVRYVLNVLLLALLLVANQQLVVRLLIPAGLGFGFAGDAVRVVVVGVLWFYGCEWIGRRR